VNVETKEQSKQWMLIHSPNKPKKLKQMLSACQKFDGNVFWDRRGVLMVEFMQTGEHNVRSLSQITKKIVWGLSEQKA
jgi:hypothetical protein